MKLESLYRPSNLRVLNEYNNKLYKLLYPPKLLNEGKRVIVTTEIIDDDDGIRINNNDKEIQTKPRAIHDGSGIKIGKDNIDEFILKAKEIGNFDDPEWVKQVINGLKQAGVQGVNHINENDKPITNKEVKKLIELLINLVGGGNG